MTTKKSLEERFSKSISRPIAKRVSWKKQPTMKLINNGADDSHRLTADIPTKKNDEFIPPLATNIIEKQEKIESKIENIEKKAENSNDQSTIPELIDDVRELYGDAVELRNDTREIIDDIKHGHIDEVVDDLSEIVEESREVISETREVIKDFKYLYGIAAGLTPIILFGLSFLISKRPK